MPGAWVFVAEHVPARRYGFGIGTLTSGITGGILLGSLVAVAINARYTPAEVGAFAWRIPFVLGGVFGLVSVYLRRFLHETPVFQELAGRRSAARELPLKTILREHRAASRLRRAADLGAVGRDRRGGALHADLPAEGAPRAAPRSRWQANAVATLTLTLGCVVVGWACDRIGTRRRDADRLGRPAGHQPTCSIPGCRARRLRWSGTTGWWACSWAASPRCRSPACARSRRRCASRVFRSPTTCPTRSSAASRR